MTMKVTEVSKRHYGPCSACGDGDTAMRYHSHDDDEKSYTLAEIEQLAEEWIDELSPGETERTVITWRFSTFLAWLKRREKEESGR